ncbi:hypothetical protein ABW20_dc0102987 [Dactylellina cionopaga]|nr:hypothetical protein ABW20_dc0102987 [Dactylellina cionopaga]
MAQTPSAPSLTSQMQEEEQIEAQAAEGYVNPLQKVASRWLQEDSTVTPIEEAMIAMSLIGDTSIPDLYQLIDRSVPEIPPETLDRANPESSRKETENEEDPSTEKTTTVGEAPLTPGESPPAEPDLVDAALKDHVEQGAAYSQPLSAGFHQASAVLRPICIAWLDKVKRNAACAVSGEPLDPEPTVEEIENLGYTPTESVEALPLSACLDIIKHLDDEDPLPVRGREMLGMDWDPVSKIYYTALPAFWGLFAGTSAFDAVKIYLDDVARIFFLPTLVTKYGTEHYFVARAMQSFGMCLGLVCHPGISVDILEMTVKAFDKLGMRLHQHTLDTFYQLAQTLPFTNKGQYGIRLAQNFHQRCLARYGPRHGRTISAMALFARGLQSQGQKPLAQNILAQTARIINGLQESEKTSKQYADALRDLGKAEFYAGANSRAAKTLTDALQRNDDLEHRGPDSSHLSFLLGMIHGQMNQWENAITFLRRSTMYRTDTFGELHRATGSSMEALSIVWEKRGAVLYENPVLELLEKLLKQYENRFGEDHQRTWNAWVKYGSAMMAKKVTEGSERVTEFP